MARITRNKIDSVAAAAGRLLAGIDRMQLVVDGMLANPRAKYGRTVQLLADGRDHMNDARQALRQIDQALADGKPRTVDDEWPTMELVAELLRQASDATEQASITFKVAADTLSR